MNDLMFNNDQKNTEFLTDEQIKTVCPVAFSEKASHEVSKHYTHIPTNRVIDDMRELGWGVIQAQQVAAQAEVQKNQALTQSQMQLEQGKSQLELQKMQQEAMLKKELMNFEFELNLKLKQMETEILKNKEKIKEDRKDERTKIQATQQSELIDQRNNKKPPKNFESSGNDIMGGGFGMNAFEPR